VRSINFSLKSRQGGGEIMTKRTYILVLLVGLMLLTGITFRMTRADDTTESTWFKDGLVRLSPLNLDEGQPNLLFALCSLKPDDNACQNSAGWDWGYDAAKALEKMGLTETLDGIVWAQTSLINALEAVQWLKATAQCGQPYSVTKCKPNELLQGKSFKTTHILELVQYVSGNPAQLTFKLHLAHGPEYCQWTAHLVGGSVVVLDGTYSDGSFIGVTYPDAELPYPFEIWCDEGHDTNYYR
jgi:hypothetical protein